MAATTDELQYEGSSIRRPLTRTMSDLTEPLEISRKDESGKKRPQNSALVALLNDLELHLQHLAKRVGELEHRVAPISRPHEEKTDGESSRDMEEDRETMSPLAAALAHQLERLQQLTRNLAVVTDRLDV